MRHGIYALLLSCWLLCAFSVPSNQDPRWEAKIEHSGGVKVFTNPAEPLYGGLDLKLTEDLTPGNDQESHLFFLVWDVKVDTQGSVFVMDSGKTRI